MSAALCSTAEILIRFLKRYAVSSESLSAMPEILQKKQGYNASLNPNVPFIEEAGIPERLDTLQASHLEAALPPLMTRISPGSLT